MTQVLDSSAVSPHAPRKDRPKMSMRELTERRFIERKLNSMIAWGKSYLAIFPFDAQFQQFQDVYQVVVRVTYRPLPEMPEIEFERVTPESE